MVRRLGVRSATGLHLQRQDVAARVDSSMHRERLCALQPADDATLAAVAGVDKGRIDDRYAWRFG